MSRLFHCGSPFSFFFSFKLFAFIFHVFIHICWYIFPGLVGRTQFDCIISTNWDAAHFLFYLDEMFVCSMQLLLFLLLFSARNKIASLFWVLLCAKRRTPSSAAHEFYVNCELGCAWSATQFQMFDWTKIATESNTLRASVIRNIHVFFFTSG